MYSFLYFSIATIWSILPLLHLLLLLLLYKVRLHLLLLFLRLLLLFLVFFLLVSTIIPIYFNYLASLAKISEVDYLAYWGYASSFTTLIVAIIGPVLGSIVDTKGYKKPIFTISMIIGVMGLAFLSVPKSWIIFLGVFVIAKIGYNASLIFYDSMLLDITDDKRMDYVSSQGYAWGYIGSCVPFVVSLVFVLFYEKMGIPFQVAMTIAFLINALWWLGMTLPLLKNYKQVHYVEKQEHPIRDSFKRLGHTISTLNEDKKVFFYLISFFFYIDGVYTIIEMATAYGSALGLNTNGLLIALLVTQIVAFPFACRNIEKLWHRIVTSLDLRSPLYHLRTIAWLDIFPLLCTNREHMVRGKLKNILAVFCILTKQC